MWAIYCKPYRKEQNWGQRLGLWLRYFPLIYKMKGLAAGHGSSHLLQRCGDWGRQMALRLRPAWATECDIFGGELGWLRQSLKNKELLGSNVHLGAGDTAQCFRGLPEPACWLTTTYISSSRTSDSLFWPLSPQACMWYTYRQTNILIT